MGQLHRCKKIIHAERRQLAGQKGAQQGALHRQGASRSGRVSVPATRENPDCPWLLSGVGGHGGRDGERSPAMTGGRGAASIGTIRCQGPPAAGTGLSPSLGCSALPRKLLLWDLVTLAPSCIPALLPPPSSLLFLFSFLSDPGLTMPYSWGWLCCPHTGFALLGPQSLSLCNSVTTSVMDVIAALHWFLCEEISLVLIIIHHGPR